MFRVALREALQGIQPTQADRGVLGAGLGDAFLGGVEAGAAGGSAAFGSISPDAFYFVLTAGAFGVTPNRFLSGSVTYP